MMQVIRVCDDDDDGGVGRVSRQILYFLCVQISV